MNDDNYDDHDMSDEEVEQVVQAAVSDLLNIAAGVAELQTTDAAAEQIYAICDLVAEYMGVERAEISTVENPDGSYTTRINPNSTPAEESVTRATGSIRTAGKPKFRVIDKNTRTDFDDDDE